MNLSIENMRTIFIVLLVTLFLFILIRELICWYFKINERVQLQKDAIMLQMDIIKLLQNIHVPKTPMHYNCRSVMDPKTSNGSSFRGG